MIMIFKFWHSRFILYHAILYFGDWRTIKTYYLKHSQVLLFRIFQFIECLIVITVQEMPAKVPSQDNKCYLNSDRETSR